MYDPENVQRGETILLSLASKRAGNIVGHVPMSDVEEATDDIPTLALGTATAGRSR